MSGENRLIILVNCHSVTGHAYINSRFSLITKKNFIAKLLVLE